MKHSLFSKTEKYILNNNLLGFYLQRKIIKLFMTLLVSKHLFPQDLTQQEGDRC